MKKKIFLQIFLLSAVCVAVVFVYGIFAVSANSKHIIGKRLIEETNLVCSLVHTKGNFNDFTVAQTSDGFRITVIDLEGNVLYESDTKAPLESHIDREEIRNALAGKPAAVERFSDTLGVQMTYYAVKTQLDDGTKIIFRMAVKSSEINNYMGITIPILIVVLVLSLIFSLVFSGIISEKITAKITEVGQSLKSLNDGNYVPIRTRSDEPELYSVLNEINELNENAHNIRQTEIDEQAKLNTVLENISQGIVAVDINNKIIFANKAALKIFGRSDEALGQDVIFLIDDLALSGEISSHLGSDYNFEYLYKNIEFSVAIKTVDGISDKAKVCSIVIFTDVTKDKEIARQKSDFFANASHELKTPVAVMQGLSELLLAKDLDDNSKKQVERIHTESVRLASLISDMLELSRLEGGEPSEEFASKVDLKATAEEVLNELSAKIAEKGITATVSGGGEIYGDAKKIYEVIENLCSNAVNYNNENGKIDITIAEKTNSVVLKVADTGIGIKKENIPRLCERFYRVDKSRSKKTGGTGLGLAIVKHICALHGATLSVDSDLGLGTTVTVIFNKDK